MSTSDQDQDQDQRRDADVPIADADTAAEAEAKPEAEGEVADGRAVADAEGDALDAPDGQDGQGGKRLSPRQARRLRIVLSALGMAAMAVVLALRIASRSSVLVVGVYGLALILCGVMIELSRNGRTRLASWLLGAGLLAAVGTDWLLLP
ncbi:hypothetical protein JHN61_25960 [Streptomyces sp. MBT67]|uniref:hypothetical protein n=1 Tax=unclassified Streptomyces TaxID=2593676 RepID=UPI00190DC152|nr:MULTISPECIES: hypothetical protein [unclassified Streptomyces]MBK3531459.1 hypothetical protein [Streptomyces sp. MBT72]MBK3539601.1 hypothetical protein [Streptomyces sp. MBT67]MBK3551664.1 hypothetical protein [Streptomyces sp. MBT61]MBK6031438.1 hypothetical protein [Streptomyces sp. MBT59]